jgi:hypothetical protein
VKDPYNENYKTLKEQIEDTRKWKELPCLWTSRTNAMKIAILTKIICRLRQIPSKI